MTAATSSPSPPLPIVEAPNKKEEIEGGKAHCRPHSCSTTGLAGVANLDQALGAARRLVRLVESEWESCSPPHQRPEGRTLGRANALPGVPRGQFDPWSILHGRPAPDRAEGRPFGEPYSYGGTKSSYMLKGLLGSRSNTVEPSHLFLQGPLEESWMHDGTKSPRPLEESWTHGGIKSPTHIYYIMMIGQQGKGDPTLFQVRVISVGIREYGLEPQEIIGLIRSCLLHNCIMSNQDRNSYNLRETADMDERNWRAQMKQCMTVMAEMYQKVIHDMRSAQDQRLTNMAQSHEMNMARILELMQQGNTGAAERAHEGNGPNPPLAPIHDDHHVEKWG
ncbi:hypothetical protein Scep_024596 [Stephania cephalantha]|uniref:Uncharacterized protein n=1 Tax=Stephania cephalantha TaxID=152367 RepID=A0AAP0EWU4_9MAGN